MFRRILATAILAGGLAGLFASGLQSWKVVPLILEAEVYEEQAIAHGHPGVAHEHANHGADHQTVAAAPEWQPAEGLERTLYTVLANLLAGVGFAALLMGAIALSGREVGPGEGVLWGLGGFAAFTLSPSLGLPPELPGMVAADLAARQAWWAGTAAATAGGLALLVFPRRTLFKVLGVVLIVAPHALGAPHGGGGGGVVPPELMARFATASVVTAGLFWVALGGLAGSFYRRFGRA